MDSLDKAAQLIRKKYPDVKDIILFGSAARGKDKPKDVDVLLLFHTSVDKKVEQEFRRTAKTDNLDVVSITQEEFEGEGFIAKEGMLLEGISLPDKNLVAKRFGFFSCMMFSYDLKKITGSKRTRFYYALQGRAEQEGLLSRTGAIKYAENNILCKYDDSEQVKTFLSLWDVPFVMTPMLIPSRLEHILFNSST